MARTLTQEVIARTALALADRDGVDALSMRRLAAELGIGTMTLYGYFRNKDALIDAALDVAAGDAGPRAKGSDWRTELRSVLQATYRNLQRHPSFVQLRLRRPLITARQLRLNETGVRILEDGGLTSADATRAFRTLFFYVFGFAAFSADDEVARSQTREAVASLPQETYPRLTGAIDHVVAVVGGAAQFDYGLDLLLDGIEQRISHR